MGRVRWIVVFFAGPGLLSCAAPDRGPSATSDSTAPKVIVLGFDGLDHDLVRKWSESGDLPHLKRLAEDGAFAPVLPSNPASSPVSWASLLTGQNPGATNVFCFVKRVITAPSAGTGRVRPGLAGMSRRTVAVEELLAAEPELRAPLADYFGAEALTTGTLLERAVFEMSGTSFLALAHERGRRVVGLRVPLAFPIDREWKVGDDDGRARILSGLLTPDAADGPGAWHIVTNDEWAPSHPFFTETGGTIHRAFPEPGGGFAVQIDAVRDRDLERELAAGDFDWEELQERLVHDGVRLRLAIAADEGGGRVSIRHDSFAVTLGVGEWSPRLPVTFRMANGRERRAVVELCFLGFSDGAFRIYVPPVAIAPDDVDPLRSFSFPAGYAADLARAVGPFRTLGWTSPTNAAKDGEIPRSVLESGIERAFSEDAALLRHELDRGEFDLLFATFHSADHAGHLGHDHDHGNEDAPDARALADDPFLRATYARIDALVGEVRGRIDAGEFGEHANLLVVSDHGMANFDYEADLAGWLEDEGYLVRAVRPSDDAPSLFALDDVDWSETRAYTLGLGKLFLNVEGREPAGIVKPEERDALAREIARKLEAWRDRERGDARIVRRAYLATEIYSGPFSDSDADIVIGFEPGYRVAWSNALGSDIGPPNDPEVSQNSSPWCRDHASVDPTAVPGVCFVYRRATRAAIERADPIDVRSIAPTVIDLLELPPSPAHECASLLRSGVAPRPQRAAGSP